MSGIYIHMEMPTSCMDCPFKGFDRAGGRGNICTINDSIAFHAVLDGVDVKFVRMGDCPLVPVPEHGRLGDLDALFNTMLEERDRIADSYGKNDEYVRCLEKYAMSMVSSAPTIISAEPPKEEQI